MVTAHLKSTEACVSQPCDTLSNKKEKHPFVWFSELFCLANSMGKVKLSPDKEKREKMVVSLFCLLFIGYISVSFTQSHLSKTKSIVTKI